MHLKKRQVFFSVFRPKTYSRHQQGSQQPSASLGFIISLLNLSYAVKAVEHQNTVNIEKNQGTE